MKETAESYLGETVTDAVINVPHISMMPVRLLRMLVPLLDLMSLELLMSPEAAYGLR